MMESRHQTILKLSTILEEYSWLFNAYNLDYFINEHWSKLPTTWKNCLETMNNIKDIVYILEPTTNQTKFLFPLSLLCLKKLSLMIRYRRRMLKDDELPVTSNATKNLGFDFSNEYTLPVKPLTSVDHILCRGIKLKKRHEIDRLCKVIPSLMASTPDCNNIIDVGSGQGHLPRILTLCYNYRVYCIEANCDNVSGATNHDHRVLKALKKYKFSNITPEAMPSKVNCFLTNEHKIDDLVGNGDELNGGHLLMGLHACGPLSNLIIDEFVNNPKSRALVLACCCYMKAGIDFFPMSSFLKQNIKFQLSAEAKELACHAVEKFLNKFATNDLDSLKVHGYRACLELIIEKCCPWQRHKAMRSVKIDSSMSFIDYVAKATRGLNVEINDEIMNSSMVLECLQLIDRVVIFYSLRLLVAPIVEHFILLDYQDYLSEQKAVKETCLMPLFDPLVSPRNLILIAKK